MSPIKVMLATASPLAASRLSRDLQALPDVVFAGHAPDLSAAYILAERTEPSVAIIGPELSRSPDFEGLVSLFRVIGTAWLDLAVEVPRGAAGPSSGAVAPGLAAADLLRALRAARPQQPVGGRSAPLQAAAAPATGGHRFNPDRLILIGASTGGIDALVQILSVFPSDCPPTAIVQHTGSAFSDSLIRLFARCCPARVVAAQSGMAMEQGTVVVGAGCNGHLRLVPGRPRRTDLQAGAPISGHMPSVDALFRSAVPFAPSVSAALLTGMGRDGAQGLLDLRRAGARTYAQDEATSVVYGMPRAAAELGAAEASLPLSRIAAELLARSSDRTPEATAR